MGEPDLFVDLYCATCEMALSRRVVSRQGQLFCCEGCADGGPCSCSYDAQRHEGTTHAPDSWLARLLTGALALLTAGIRRFASEIKLLVSRLQRGTPAAPVPWALAREPNELMLGQLLDVLSDRLSPADADRLLRETGRRLAASVVVIDPERRAIFEPGGREGGDLDVSWLTVTGGRALDRNTPTSSPAAKGPG